MFCKSLVISIEYDPFHCTIESASSISTSISNWLIPLCSGIFVWFALFCIVCNERAEENQTYQEQPFQFKI